MIASKLQNRSTFIILHALTISRVFQLYDGLSFSVMPPMRTQACGLGSLGLDACTLCAHACKDTQLARVLLVHAQYVCCCTVNCVLHTPWGFNAHAACSMHLRLTGSILCTVGWPPPPHTHTHNVPHGSGTVVPIDNLAPPATSKPTCIAPVQDPNQNPRVAAIASLGRCRSHFAASAAAQVQSLHCRGWGP